MQQSILDLTPEIAADCALAVTLRLGDLHGRQLGYHRVRLAEHPASRWEALFDTGGYVARYAGVLIPPGQATALCADELLADLGVFIHHQLLGPEIAPALAGSAHRTLLIRLPRPADPTTAPLIGALARIPWESARPTPAEAPLAERNLVLRLLLEGTAPAAGTTPLDLGPDEDLRVLLVYAEAPGSRPLAMRQEREGLLALLREEVQPRGRLRVDVLCHGVTRAGLREQVAAAGGYHLLHWSGHGHRNLLELQGEDGRPEPLSGEDLAALLQEAGGFYPRLVFLSACHSGALGQPRNWSELRAALGLSREGAPTDRDPDAAGSAVDLDASLTTDPGLAGTALALLSAGVPQVVAMRWAVGDDYARGLAHRFYRHLLGTGTGEGRGYSADSALNQARKDLRRPPESAGLDPADHANPLILGAERVELRPHPGRSRQLDRRHPRPQPLLAAGRRDLDPRAHFVGRGAPLTRLNRDWLKTGTARAVALVQGLAGLGKTALAAECIALWHRRFDWVLCLQTRPEPLSADGYYRTLDQRLGRDSQVYRETCAGYPAGRIYLEPGPDWTGAERFERMRTNLLAAAEAESILFVLDNFEPNLIDPDPQAPAGSGLACRDPEWDRFLTALAEGLPRTRSRLLVTSRHSPAALVAAMAAGRCLWLPLGPLPLGEAALYLRQCPALTTLIHGSAADLALARRCLEVSRGHPLILERLCTLAGDPRAPDRAGLTQALDTLGRQGGYARLPDLFAGRGDAGEQAAERRYLEDVAIGAVDLLLARQTADGRRLLWVLALAGEPVDAAMLEGVRSGRDPKSEVREQLRQLLAIQDQLPEKARALLDQLPPEMRATLETPEPPLAPEARVWAKARPVPEVLAALHQAGLIHRESEPAPGTDPADADGGPWTCHELVRERAIAWMATHPGEPAGRTADQVLRALGERFEALFKHLLGSGTANARDHAVEAGRRALGYCIRAGALERLHGFVGRLITSTRDPRLLDGLVQRLGSVAEQVSEGQARWSLRTYIADGLLQAGRADESLPFYAQAAAEAESAGDWADLGWITQNQANALRNAGELEAAKVQYRASAEASRKAGHPEVFFVASEIESLRIDVMQGGAESARPEIERLLAQVRGWWQRHRAGGPVPEAPDPEVLGRGMVSALDIARQAARSLEDWEGSLALLDEQESVDSDLGTGEHERARTRFNRYGPLLRLGRLAEAQSVLESCLEVFRRCDDITAQATTFSALADLWDRKGDPGQAADLGRRALDLSNRLPDPGDRGISHNNLAGYLERLGQGADAAPHRLAALCYDLIGGYGDLLRGHVRNLSIVMAESRAQDQPYPLPTLERLLADPRFDALRRFIAERAIDPAELQEALDALIAQAAP